MKKVVMALIGASLCAQFAQADIAISWSAGDGFYNWNAGGSPTDPNDYVNFGGGSIAAYLIYSTDNVRDFDYSNVAGQYLSGGDYVLASLTGITGNDYGNFDAGTTTVLQPLQGGYVYARVIDTTAPGGGVQYYDSSVLLTTAWVSPASPQDLFVNTTAGGIGDRMIAVVPEPTVLAFLGIGAALVGVRRMRRA